MSSLNLSQHFCFVFVLASLIGSVATSRSRVHDETFIPDAVLNITTKNISQSCLPTRSTIVVNGTTPGPELRLTAGKTQWIRVYNNMIGQNLTMHWHGLSMAVSPFSDGTTLASQWPIPPLHFFDYEINVPKNMAGTYFYHSHVGFQAVTASGPLIVDEEKPPYKYDGEKIIYISDVFQKNDSTIEKGLLSNPFVWSGETAMIMINGKGGGTANGTFCNAPLSVIDVEPGKTYRLRFIGATALTFASIAIEGHKNLTVIEADGSYTKPYNTSFLQIGSGQRFSILLDTKPKPEKKTFSIQIESRERPTLTTGYAILNYGSKPTTPFYPPAIPVLTLPNTCYGWLDYALTPLHSNNFPTAKEVTRRVTVTVHQRVDGYITWVENTLPWTDAFPCEPYLVSLYKNDSVEFPSITRALKNNGLDPVTRAFPACIGEVLEIVIQNTGSDSGGLDAHPFHAHGGHYYDIGSGNGSYDAKANERRLAGTRPVLRDTTMLYRYENKTVNGTAAGWRAWRLRVTEPGVWMVHCHILQHMIMGMQTVWVMGNSSEILYNVTVPEVQGYLTYGGDVYGNETHAPTVVHFQDDWEDNQ